MGRIKEVKYTDNDGTGYIYMVNNEFVIHGVSLAFTDNKCRIMDSRVTADSLVDVYFTADSFAAAIDAGVTVDSGDGFIDIVCTSPPQSTLTCTIAVKII